MASYEDSEDNWDPDAALLVACGLCDRNFEGRAGQLVLKGAMEILADCQREVLSPSADGPPLGTIFNAAEFRKVLEERGLTIVPTTPSLAMQAAWKHGWFLNFGRRYRAMLGAIWPSE